jgi:hypothetical protein
MSDTWHVRSATDEDLDRDFGSRNLVIGFPVKAEGGGSYFVTKARTASHGRSAPTGAYTLGHSTLLLAIGITPS